LLASVVLPGIAS